MLGPIFIAFLHLHAAVLEPDFHLSLGEVEQPRDLVPAVTGEIHVKEELLLQLESLVFGVRAALFPGGTRVEPVGRGIICKTSRK